MLEKWCPFKHYLKTSAGQFTKWWTAPSPWPHISVFFSAQFGLSSTLKPGALGISALLFACREKNCFFVLFFAFDNIFFVQCLLVQLYLRRQKQINIATVLVLTYVVGLFYTCPDKCVSTFPQQLGCEASDGAIKETAFVNSTLSSVWLFLVLRRCCFSAFFAFFQPSDWPKWFYSMFISLPLALACAWPSPDSLHMRLDVNKIVLNQKQKRNVQKNTTYVRTGGM